MRQVLVLVSIAVTLCVAGCELPTTIMSTSDVEESAFAHYDAAGTPSEAAMLGVAMADVVDTPHLLA